LSQVAEAAVAHLLITHMAVAVQVDTERGSCDSLVRSHTRLPLAQAVLQIPTGQTPQASDLLSPVAATGTGTVMAVQAVAHLTQITQPTEQA
jgi:hypothetical protein